MKHMLYKFMLMEILFCLCVNQCSCIAKIFLVKRKALGQKHGHIYMMEIISKEVSLLIFRGDSHGILKGGQKNSDRFSNIGYILMGGNASGMQLHLKRIVFWSHLYPNAINQG